MKYEDYKVEEMMFTNKIDWTEEEMREVLDTFPESKNWEKKLAALKQLKKDIDDDVIKKNRYGELNGVSTKAYAKKHELFYYENEYDYGYSYNKFYIMIDGREEKIKYSSCVDHLIYLLSNDIKKRFDNISRLYKKKEDDWFKNDERNKYEEINKARIDAGERAYTWLQSTSLMITTGIQKDSTGYSTYGYHPERWNLRLKFRGDDYCCRNSYGEFTFNGEPVSEEDANRICEICEDISKRTELLIRRYDAELNAMRLKYYDIAKQRMETKENKKEE